jgi:hypothetical protein
MRFTRSEIAQLVGVAVLALIFGWWWLSPKRPDAAYIYQCRHLYAAARTAADTVRVDGTIALQQDKPRVEPPACGALRATYPKEFESSLR